MSRRKADTAEIEVKKERWNKWRILLRRQEFQTSLFQLRQRYREWVDGPPIDCFEWDYDDPEYDDEGHKFPREILCEIARKDADPDKHDLDRREPMLEAWDHFNFKWGIRLPKVALTEELPKLSPKTVAEWESLGEVSSRVVPPPITDVRAPGRRYHRLTLTLDLDYPRDILLTKVDEEIAKAVQSLPKNERKGSLAAKRKRRRHDKLTFQLRVYDLYMCGEPTWQIARTLRKPRGTVNSALATAVKIVRGERPRTGRAWEKHHLKVCRRCRANKTLDFFCPAVVQQYRKIGDAATHRQRDSTYLPPLPVQGEKSAFGG